MCCFSGGSGIVESVSGTKIFARIEGDRQFLVYEMVLSAKDAVAMVLPLPVRAGSGENAVRFIDLSGYPDFFKHMHRGFPSEELAFAAALDTGRSVASAPLKVHTVGSFEASYVPTIKDFSRLDARFRLSDKVWEALPQVADYGFAVFKLKPGNEQHVHPMAFDFPIRNFVWRPKPQGFWSSLFFKPERIVNPGATEELFFPTLHVHDGAVHRNADFDHDLYFQCDGIPLKDGKDNSREPALFDPDFATSYDVAETFVNVGKTHGIVKSGAKAWHWRMRGSSRNQDMTMPIKPAVK
jgi:hypothetical protein